DAKISYDKKGPRMTTWSPSNYDGKFRGEVTLEYALVHSLNTVVVRLIDYVGVNDVLTTARAMGFTSPHLPSDLSLALGSASVTPLEMAAVFSVFANNGKAVTPMAIREVKSALGDTLEKNSPSVRPAISPETAILTRSVLLDAVRSGTGRRALLEDRQTFGKTGTTNEFIDAWFLGGVPGLVAAVYAGNDDHKPLASKGATGGVIAAPVWKEFVAAAVQGRDLPKTFSIPPDAAVESVKICRTTGYRAIKGCPAVTLSIPVGKAPRTNCPVHGGELYASAQDSNRPRLILVHGDKVSYASLPQEDVNIPLSTGSHVAVTKPSEVPQTAVPDSTQSGYKDPNPAASVEERYQDLLKQYGITN
ncbi:MAG TPA: penicillin-binding protein, partial [Synergistaceae bacterium]|nr:penicillin-binding protein [Synergistaceae bacterium]